MFKFIADHLIANAFGKGSHLTVDPLEPKGTLVLKAGWIRKSFLTFH